MTRNRDLANLIAGGFTESDIPNLSASKITSGTFANARLSEGSVTQHVTAFDDNKLVNDLSTLALRQASNENKVGYNTNSMSVDVFQDSSKITNLTNSARSEDEYVQAGTLTAGQTEHTADANTDLLLISNTTDGSTTLTDSSTDGHAVSFQNGASHQTEQSKLGSSSMFLDGSNDRMQTNGNVADLNLGNKSNLYTIEGWIYPTASSPSGYLFTYGTYDQNAIWRMSFDGSQRLVLGVRGSTNWSWDNIHSVTMNTAFTQNTWSHFAFVNNNGTVTAYKDGSSDGTGTITKTNTHNDQLFIGNYFSSSGSPIAGYLDSLRISNNARYTSNFTPNGGIVVNATGSFEGTTVTAPSSVSSMGAIITYQNQAGTNALNTDIVLKLSADNGSNYSTATLTAMPDFSSGIKMAKVNDLSVTAGTQLKYKLEFANQSASKEARIRGVSLQY